MILKARGIKKVFRSTGVDTEVIKGIDLKIEEGEFVAIMGKSGSGKSTLLNILSTLDFCDEGEIFYDNKPIHKLKDEESARLRREEFGFVFQMPRMLKNLNILDNILLPSLKYKTDRKDVINEALILMKKVGIFELQDKKISQVSGGQLQRVGICRALINRPKLIFADEPTGALDSKSGSDVMELFGKINKEGKSILMVTHDIHVAAKARKVIFMKDGTLLKSLEMTEKEEINLCLIKNEVDQF